MIGHRSRTSGTPLLLLRGGVLGFVVAAGLALAVRGWLQLGVFYPLKVTGFFAAIVAVAMVFVGEGHPFPRLGPANGVTMTRALLLALVAGLIGEPSLPAAAGFGVATMAIVAVLDGVDGRLARSSRMASEFGARFDMELDGLVVMVLSVLVWQHAKAGVWVLLGGLLRYAFIAAGWWLPWMARPLRPTHRAKTVAVAHTVGLCVALAPVVPVPLSAVAAAVTLASLCWSFAVDVGRLVRDER